MIKQSFLSVFIGVTLVYGLHFYFNMAWTTEGSIDTLLGTIFEFFLFQLLLNIWNVKSERAWKKQLDSHLDKIELLLKKTYSNVKEKDKG